MKVIVTGGAGFLGKHLCKSLVEAGHELKIIDLVANPDFPTIIADIRDQEQMMIHIKDADVVFHLAALIEAGESVKKPHDFVRTNITGSLNVLEAMKANGITTFIFSSTAAVYGEPKAIPITEDNPTRPINPYGVTKLAMEAMLSSYVANFGFTGIALRYFNLYGPKEYHSPETHAIPRFIDQIYHDQEVTVWGNGEHQRDFIYVADVVDAHLKALDFSQVQPKQFHFFNISTQQPTSVIDVIHLIEKYLGKSAKITHFDPRPGDPMVLYASAQKARQTLRWQPQVGIEEGLEKTVAYFAALWES